MLNQIVNEDVPPPSTVVPRKAHSSTRGEGRRPCSALSAAWLRKLLSCFAVIALTGVILVSNVRLKLERDHAREEEKNAGIERDKPCVVFAGSLVGEQFSSSRKLA